MIQKDDTRWLRKMAEADKITVKEYFLHEDRLKGIIVEWLYERAIEDTPPNAMNLADRILALLEGSK